MDLKDWVRIGEALENCAFLEDVVDFSWSKMALGRGVASVDLDKRDIGDLEAAVLSSLLLRNTSTLTTLRLWYLRAPKKDL